MVGRFRIGGLSTRPHGMTRVRQEKHLILAHRPFSPYSQRFDAMVVLDFYRARRHPFAHSPYALFRAATVSEKTPKPRRMSVAGSGIGKGRE